VQVVLHGVELGRRDAEVLGDLGLGGRTAEDGGQRLHGLGLLAAGLADRAARPAAAAQLVDDRAADAGAGVPLERDAAALVEATCGLHEAEQACGVQVAEVDVAGEAHGDLSHDVAHQRHVRGDELVVGLGGGCKRGHEKRVADSPFRRRRSEVRFRALGNS